MCNILLNDWHLWATRGVYEASDKLHIILEETISPSIRRRVRSCPLHTLAVTIFRARGCAASGATAAGVAPTEKESLSPLAATAAGRALRASRATAATRRPAAGGRTTSSTGYGPGRVRWRPSSMSS